MAQTKTSKHLFLLSKLCKAGHQSSQQVSRRRWKTPTLTLILTQTPPGGLSIKMYVSVALWLGCGQPPPNQMAKIVVPQSWPATVHRPMFQLAARLFPAPNPAGLPREAWWGTEGGYFMTQGPFPAENSEKLGWLENGSWLTIPLHGSPKNRPKIPPKWPMGQRSWEVVC